MICKGCTSITEKSRPDDDDRWYIMSMRRAQGEWIVVSCHPPHMIVLAADPVTSPNQARVAKFESLTSPPVTAPYTNYITGDVTHNSILPW